MRQIFVFLYFRDLCGEGSSASLVAAGNPFSILFHLLSSLIIHILYPLTWVLSTGLFLCAAYVSPFPNLILRGGLFDLLCSPVLSSFFFLLLLTSLNICVCDRQESGDSPLRPFPFLCLPLSLAYASRSLTFHSLTTSLLHLHFILTTSSPFVPLDFTFHCTSVLYILCSSCHPNVKLSSSSFLRSMTTSAYLTSLVFTFFPLFMSRVPSLTSDNELFSLKLSSLFSVLKSVEPKCWPSLSRSFEPLRLPGLFNLSVSPTPICSLCLPCNPNMPYTPSFLFKPFTCAITLSFNSPAKATFRLLEWLTQKCCH